MIEHKRPATEEAKIIKNIREIKSIKGKPILGVERKQMIQFALSIMKMEV